MTSARQELKKTLLVLLVIVPVAILILMVWPKFYPPFRGRPAKIVQAQTDVSLLGVALDNFKADTGRYPTSAEGLAALSVAPGGIPNWKGPYIERPVSNDPWGHPYVYVWPGKHNPNSYDLYSLGPSGKDGTKENIDNWTAR